MCFYNNLYLMLSAVDFRNGRYQGETRSGIPEGVGIFFSVQLVFVIGHWRGGLLEGRSIIIYPDATVFCGRIKEGRAEGLCYYELERETIKVYFQGEKEDKQGKLAITIPNFSKILTVDSANLSILAQSQLRKGDSKANIAEVSRIIGKKEQIRDEYEYQGFIQYFEVHFAIPYSDIFEHLIINANGFVEYWMGFKQEGLGIKVRPLPMEQSGGRSYRICEMGIMTRENVLFGMGLKSTNGVLGRVQIEEGIFALPHTLTSYRLSQGPSDKTRSAKSLSTFLNFLKRSMTFRDCYLILKEVSRFKENINRIHELTFTEMKVKNAHQIIESPLKDQAVRVEIERKRRKREQEIEQYKRARRTNNQPSIYNTGANMPPGSTFTLATLRQDLQRSISKRKLSKSKLTTFENVSYYDSPSKQSQTNSTKVNANRSSQKRANGSITPTKVKRQPSQQKKPIGIIANKMKQSPNKKSSTKYPQRDEIREEKPPVMAPILKPPPQSSPKKRKVTYIQKQLEQWEKQKLKFTKPSTNSPPKKYGTNTRSKATSPVKSYSRPLLTENIFN